MPYSQQQTGLFSDRIDKDKNNWGMLVKIACLYTSYCLSLFIMKMHLLVQFCKQKAHWNIHLKTMWFSPCDRTSTSFTVANQILHYAFFLLPNSNIEVGFPLLNIIFVFLIIENTFQTEASMMRYNSFALLLEQERGHALRYSHTSYAKFMHSFTKKHRQF